MLRVFCVLIPVIVKMYIWIKGGSVYFSRELEKVLSQVENSSVYDLLN